MEVNLHASGDVAMYVILGLPVGLNSCGIDDGVREQQTSTTLKFQVKSFAHTIQYFGCIFFLLRDQAIEFIPMHSFRLISRWI